MRSGRLSIAPSSSQGAHAKAPAPCFLVDGFSLASGQTFDIIGTGDGLTNRLTSLSLLRHLHPVDARSRHAGPRRDKPGGSRAQRHGDTGSGTLDLGDGARGIRGPWRPRLPGLAKDRSGRLNAAFALRSRQPMARRLPALSSQAAGARPTSREARPARRSARSRRRNVRSPIARRQNPKRPQAGCQATRRST